MMKRLATAATLAAGILGQTVVALDVKADDKGMLACRHFWSMDELISFFSSIFKSRREHGCVWSHEVLYWKQYWRCAGELA